MVCIKDRNTHTIILDSDAIASLGYKFWKLMPGKIKISQRYHFSNVRINLGPLIIPVVYSVKHLLKTLVLSKFSLMESTQI